KRAVVGSRKRGGSPYLRGRGTRGDQSDLAGSRATLRPAVEGGGEGMATALREASRTLGSGIAAKSTRNKRIEHRPVVGPLPGEPGARARCGTRPGTLLRK